MRFEEIQRERYKEGFNLGVEYGVEQGMEQGIEIGREQGVETGVKSTTINFIKTMLKNSEPDDKICLYANCTPEYLSEVKKEIG